MNRFRVPLFKNRKEILLFFSILLSIFLFNVFSEYRNYERFASYKYRKIKAFVLNQYKKRKGKREYFVLKLKTSDGALFYTTSYKNLENLKDREILLTVITEKVSFWDYLKGFYAPSFGIKVYPKKEGVKNFLREKISSFHLSDETKELFGALFLGENLSKEVREKIQFLGLSHLVAISGFHLGVLFGVLFFIGSVFYSPFHDRFFPYRNKKFDITVFATIVLFFYLYMLDFVPSLLRAFTMSVIGFLFYARAVEVVSFLNLFIAVSVILAFFPKLVFSIGFWFSVAGVFYIFLFLKYFGDLNKAAIFFLLNFWVFFMMMPLVHYFFPVFSFYQLLSPFVSMLFTVFYPLELFLHIFGFGDFLDGLILKFINIKGEVYNFRTDFYFLSIFILFSFGAVFRRIFLFLLIFLSFVFLIENITKLHSV